MNPTNFIGRARLDDFLQRGIALILRSAFVVLIIAINAFVFEITLRAVDGFQIFSLRLKRQHLVDWRTPIVAPPNIPLADGIKSEWFELSPHPYPREPSPDFVAFADRHAWMLGRTELSYVFNSRFANRLCSHPYYNKLPIIFLFDSPSIAGGYPTFRFPLNTVTPSGLATNQFGWRGPSIDLRKPANTIRIAFVGGSTTVNNHSFPFSYPELVGFWLDRWAQENFGVRIEAINVGREGMQSPSIAAVVRDELLPLEPDLVVYYEGANQFSPVAITKFERSPPPLPMETATRRFLNELALYSTIVQRALNIAARFSWNGDEPERLAYNVVWPSDIDEFDPPLDHPDLPSNLSVIVRDLDSIKSVLESQGATLVATSFFWLVFDGMKLDPGLHQGYISYLALFPYRYREMERMAAFQNRVFKKYAMTRGLPFLDVASAIPRDLGYYNDSIHATYPGVRRHAWIVTQQLAPIIRDRVERKALPRPSQSNLTAHPAFPGNERTARLACTPEPSNLKSVGHADLTTGIEAQAPAIVSAGPPLQIRVPPDTRLYHYLVMVRLPEVETPQLGRFMVKVQIKVTGGDASIGVLSADQKHFLNYQRVEAAKDFVWLPITLSTSDQKLGPLVIAAGTPRSNEVTIELRDAELLTGSLYRFPTIAPGIKFPQ